MSVALASDPELRVQLVFDYCINVNAEVTWTWDTKWTLVRVLFLLARYVPFILVPVCIYSLAELNGLHPTDDLRINFLLINCLPWGGATTGMITISIAAAEGLLLIRTWVLWGKKWVVLIALTALGSLFLSSSPILTLQVVIHSVFGSRLLFSLRQIMRQQHIMSISAAQSTFRNADEMPPMVFAEDVGVSSRAVGVEYEC
ncbi:hypothetical protein BJ138DRAFT_1106506 [Hygrophoropsis aurantiaca]|uniref:Uncharacterized protein n=1 Tax=Hygrophoropsis aurantiaca TaxID=72124 RepID=A0ACB7ZVC7_9AGAM|nr:hypothetical protein BJ138DRAFT_1106506 [Hygrophoropsis aurantiaca]